MKKELFGLSLIELQELLVAAGLKKFRAAQVYQWLYQKSVTAFDQMRNLSASQIADLAKTFCNEVKKAGYHPMIYCNTDWYDNKLDWSKMTGYDVWLARYGDTIPAPDKKKYKYTIWQSTDRKSVV